MASLHGIQFGRGLFVIGAILVASAWQARADDQYLGVARISVLNGTVVLQHSTSADKIAALVNAPVMAGDYVSTGPGSRAEVQLDDTDFIRAGAQTQMRFTQLDANAQTVQLAAGTIEMSVLRYPDTHPQMQTPSIIIRPLDSGRYRVTVTDTGDTLLTVRSGRAEIVAPQGTQTVGAGISVLISGAASDPQVQNVATIGYDDFDSWSIDRDRFMASALAATAVEASAYANSGIVGLSALNSYGSWSNAPAYGSVWVPYGQFVGWSPYRYGRWAYQPYCGWTWIGYEPWGWAPYHYGRWFYRPGFGWAWYPGPRYAPYYWQPALVAFFGFGYGGGFSFGVNFSFGNVGWVPLAPFEAYNPWWRRGYVGRPIAYNNTNITNIHDITRVYHNAGAPGGIAAVRGGALNGGGRYDYLQVHAGDLHGVALAKGGLPVAPSTAGYRYTTGPGDVSRIEPMSPRFSELPQPALPTISRSIGASTQTVGRVPVAERAAAIAPATTGSGNAWSRFGSTNAQTVTVTHTLHGTQTFIGSNGGTKAVASTETQAHNAAGPNVWSRFDSMGGTNATATGTARTSTVLHNTVTNAPIVQRNGDPSAYRLPMTPYTQYTPNGSSPGRNAPWMSPRSYMPSPSGAGANFSGGGSNGNNSGHAGHKGH
jgi:hypothetical protein